MPDLGWREAIVKIRQDAGEPMHYTDIAEAIAEQQPGSDLGATPANSVNATISMSLRNDRDGSPFVRVARGQYYLRNPPDHGAPPSVEPEDEVDGTSEDTGLINAFGMYWARDRVLWRSSPQILGQQQSTSTPVDFCGQKGVYLLHDARDVIYVGRTTDQPLGVRLRQHTADRLNGRWDRFSWFGVYGVTEEGALEEDHSERFSLDSLIVAMEALLIEGLEPPQNRKRGDDFRAVEFLQVEDPELEKSHILDLMEELKKKL